MGKKVDKVTKAPKIKNENNIVAQEKKPKKEEKAQANKSVKKEQKQTPPEKHSKKKIENTPKVEEEQEINDEQILGEVEESQIQEDLIKRYEFVLKEIRETLTPNLDLNLIMKAVKSLKKIVLDKYQNSVNLLQNENEEFLFINFVLGKLPFKFSMRPNLINLPHSVYGEKFYTRVCLFVKDPVSDFEDLNINKSFPFQFNVIDVNTLKLNYSRFQDRRNLLKEYELFLCDSKIYFLLKKLLGKPFYVHKKYPLPIKLDLSNPEEIKNTITSNVEKSTTFYMTHGPNYCVKISRATSSNEEILENINEGIYQTLAHILKWGANFEE